MELKEQPYVATLAQKLGDTTHVSGLLRKVCQLSGLPETRVAEWLLKCAFLRGASHYRRDFNLQTPPDNPALSNEELGVALCLGHHPFEPMLIRAAAQLLSSDATDAKLLARLAEMERCEPVLLHIAAAAAQHAPEQQPWAALRAKLSRRHRVRTDDLPHWSRFVNQTGYTPAGRGQHVDWLTRDE